MTPFLGCRSRGCVSGALLKGNAASTAKIGHREVVAALPVPTKDRRLHTSLQLISLSVGRTTQHPCPGEAVPSWLRIVGVAAAFLGSTWCLGSAQANSRVSAPRVTELAGSRGQPGLFTQRLILPANFCGPVHTHDRDLHGLVLRGVLLMGVADSTERIRVREFPAGSFVVVPAGRRHVEGSKAETEIHLSGIGPLKTVVVDSTSRRRCAAGQSD